MYSLVIVIGITKTQSDLKKIVPFFSERLPYGR